MNNKLLALVTGGTRGIGEAISIALKEAGYEVAATYASNDLKAAEFTKHTSIKAYKFDVAKLSECEEAVKQIESDFGMPVKILINNAGITRDGLLHKANDDKFWNEVIDTNLSSCFNMCKTVINKMREQNYGRIVNITSINGQKGQIGQVNYSAAKAGIIGFTKALALESAKNGITVNAIAPGYTETEMVAAVKPEILESIIAQIPVRRLGKAKEIARTVLFLVHEDAGFITGETISVNGGQYMG
ncbi:MAG: 3-oxoacyl-ACP reductase [Alphaproteobacteria bacterium]